MVCLKISKRTIVNGILDAFFALKTGGRIKVKSEKEKEL
jgi:hypothetical protein